MRAACRRRWRRSTNVRDGDGEARARGLRGRFETIVCGDQVPKTKPAPDVYLAAVGQLGFDPRACIAVEDSDVGLRAAHGAGLTCIVVPDMVPPREEYAGLAHCVVGSLGEARGVIEGLLG